MKTSGKQYDDAKNEEQIAWVKAFQAGDREAGEKVYTDYIPLIRCLSYDSFQKCINEDLYQHLSLALVEKMTTYKEERCPILAGYLKQSLKWAKYDYLRKEIPYQNKETVELSHAPEGQEETSYALSEKEIQPLTEIAAGFLQKRQRPLFHLMVSGKKPEEIENTLHITPQNFYNQRKHIRNRFRNNPDFQKTIETWGIAG